MSLDNAIIDRWNSQNLDSLVKDLWPGSSIGPDEMLKPGSSNMKSDGGPADELLPRARYNTMPAELVEMTAGSKVYGQKFFIFVYAKNMSDLDTYSDLIINTFENAHIAPTDPFSMDEGCVIHLDWVERQDNVRYGEVKFTELLFEVIYVRPRVFPS